MADRDDRVLPVTRALSVVIVPFLVVAWVVLFVFPDDSDQLFAWPIKPRMSAMVLGSVYLGGAYFFVRAATAHHWHRVKAGFVPVGTFATMMGIATVIHWDKFNHDHVAFWLWAGLYFTTPVLVFAVWFANRRHDAPVSGDDVALTDGARLAFGAVGALALVTSLYLFLAPGRVVDSWPWTLTPLTARVLGAIFALGIGGLYVATDRRWTAAKTMIEVQGVMLLLILGAGILAHTDLDLSEPLGRSLVVGFAATLLAGGALYARMEGRARAAHPPAPDLGGAPRAGAGEPS